MGVSLFLCPPRARSADPSCAFPQARVDYVAPLCHVSGVFAYVRGPFYRSRRMCAGDRVHQHVVTISICSCGQ